LLANRALQKEAEILPVLFGEMIGAGQHDVATLPEEQFAHFSHLLPITPGWRRLRDLARCAGSLPIEDILVEDLGRLPPDGQLCLGDDPGSLTREPLLDRVAGVASLAADLPD
jgi:hypothetical protein